MDVINNVLDNNVISTLYVKQLNLERVNNKLVFVLQILQKIFKMFVKELLNKLNNFIHKLIKMF